MKKMLLPLCLLCTALLLSLGVSAQSPIYLGSANGLKSQLSPTAANNAARNTAPTLTLQVDDHKELTIVVNSQAGNSLIGKVDQKDASDFFIQFNGNDVKGNIVLKAEKLAYKIYSDVSGNVYLEETDIHNVLCIDNPVRPAQHSQARTQAAALPNVYTLQSLPSATAVAYLDFDGEYVVNTAWNGGAAINALPSGMTDEDIYLAWQITSEDYRPFNINITTDVTVYNNAPVGKRMRVIVTPTWDAMPNSGGVAYIGSFTWTDNTPCWAFTTGVGTGGKNIGEVSSHELGHTFSLLHDGRNFPDGSHEEYFGGQGDWAPIMGVAYGASLGQWSKGEYQYANNQEDDVVKISSLNGFTYRADEYGNTQATAGNLVVAGDGSVLAANNNGVITERTDVDVIAFTTTGGLVQLNINPSEVYPDLNIYATLLNSQGVIVATGTANGLGAVISYTAAAGTYYISIDGVGAGDPFNTGYSDYASIGYYSVSGTINGSTQNQAPVVHITSPANNSIYAPGSNITIEATATDADGTITKVSFYKNGTELLSEDLTAPYSYTWTNVPVGTYAISAVATDNSSLTGTDLIYITVTAGNPCGTTLPWSATTIYSTPGQQVHYQGNIFENKWWTQNEVPNINDQWGVWKFIRACSTNRAPVVTFTSPIQNSIFQEGTAVTLTADAVDPDGSVSRVNFYQGAFFSDYDDAAPFSITKTLAPGSYVYSAVAVDNLGLSGDAAYVSFIVNALPTASFILPVENSSYPLGGTLPISINASDADGNITKVEFFLGSMSNKVGEDVSAPYSISFSPIPPATSAQGNYLPVIAKLTDNNGGISVISTFIQVTQSVDQCNNIPQYVNNGGYSAGSIVKNVGKRYECKPWPYSGWCNAAASAYAPGTGTNWSDAWTELGSCGASAPVSLGSSASSTAASLTVSPNPSNSSIRVEYPQNGNSTLQLSDAMGNQVLLQEFNSGNTVDLSSLPAGVYILQIRTEGDHYTQRVVKY